ncbi:GOLPH3/VPS74 family protein [Gephyromycinifex aptenodytis]|uniref:GOLPH3/VPS74 family protein n=1 Tax=Gephyromycinifex aptenodytis TaxID=2716227 RepID=UPI001446ACF5|nr:GPP34 family phosphoprotein [Gephyromycinifex aptenodytis]
MEFTLADEMFLLGTTPQGRPALRDLPYLVTGAAMAELAAAGRIDAPRRALEVLDPCPVGEDVLDALLARLNAARRPRHPWRWIYDESRGVLHAERERLATAGVLGTDHDVVAGFLPRTRHPVVPGAREPIVETVRACVIGSVEPDERTRVLLGLLSVAYQARRTARELFPELQAGALRARLIDLAEPTWVIDATANAIRLAGARR